MLFRHNDIEREHYHVVSVRYDKESRKIKDFHEWNRIYDYALKLGHEYGFTMPLDEQGERHSQREEPVGKRFVPGKAVIRQLTRIFMRTLQDYSYASFDDLAVALRSCGVRAFLNESPTGPYVSLQGLDSEGKAASVPISEKRAGLSLYRRFEEERVRNEMTHYRHVNQTAHVLRLAFDNTRTAIDLSNYLKRLGIEPIVIRDSESGQLTVKFPNKREKCVVDIHDIRYLFIKDRILQALLVTQQGKSSQKIHISFTQVCSLFRPLSQPKGNSWNGKTPKTKEQLREEREMGRSGALNANFEDHRFEEKIH